MAVNPGICVQVDVELVKPECFFDYMKIIPREVEIVKKAGGHPIDQYTVEAGGAPEVIFITKFGKSFTSRNHSDVINRITLPDS